MTRIDNLNLMQIEEQLENLSIQPVSERRRLKSLHSKLITPKNFSQKIERESRSRLRRKSRRQLKRKIRKLKLELKRMKDMNASPIDDDNICLKDWKMIRTKDLSNLTAIEQQDDIPMVDQIVYSIDCKN